MSTTFIFQCWQWYTPIRWNFVRKYVELTRKIVLTQNHTRIHYFEFYTTVTNAYTKNNTAETPALLAEDELLVHPPPGQSSVQSSASHLRLHPPPLQIRWQSFTPAGQVMVHPPPAQPSVHFAESQVLSQPPPAQSWSQYLRFCEQVTSHPPLMQLSEHSAASQEIMHPRPPVQVALLAEDGVIPPVSISGNRVMSRGSAIPLRVTHKSTI